MIHVRRALVETHTVRVCVLYASADEERQHAYEHSWCSILGSSLCLGCRDECLLMDFWAKSPALRHYRRWDFAGNEQKDVKGREAAGVREWLSSDRERARRGVWSKVAHPIGRIP